MLKLNFLGLCTISKSIKQYFPCKRLKNVYFSCEIDLMIGERPNKINIESIKMTRIVNILRL